MKTSINNNELINSGGGWAPGKLDHDKIPFLVWPPKPLKFLKWLLWLTKIIVLNFDISFKQLIISFSFSSSKAFVDSSKIKISVSL